MDCNILVFSNLEPWNSNFINDIIVSRGLVQFKDQTQNEDHTWYLRFYMYHKMLSCQTCRHEKRICQLMSSWLSCGLDSIYWPDTKWGPELISQLWNFIRLVGIKKEIYIYDVSMTVTFLSEIYRPDIKWGPYTFDILGIPKISLLPCQNIWQSSKVGPHFFSSLWSLPSSRDNQAAVISIIMFSSQHIWWNCRSTIMDQPHIQNLVLIFYLVCKLYPSHITIKMTSPVL